MQFDALFTDDLYFEIGRHAIEKAEELKEIFRSKNLDIYLESPTNQQFIVLENRRMEELKKQIKFSFWENLDDNRTVVRFVTSWSTTDEDLELLRRVL